ncbi:hypothetical protein CRUP_013241 [Coryphaenoides rupestris]|nr:hypothetical protein CRUP_013241 [Coryphaenoides rupestris]
MDGGGETPTPQPGARCPRRVTVPGVLCVALLALLAVSVSGVGVTGGPGQPEPPPRRLRRGWLWNQLVVPEEDPTPRTIGKIKSDYDGGAIRYILSGEGAGDIFEIDEDTGEVRTCRKLDREEKAFYVLQAQAIDTLTQEPVEPQSEFIIKVQDINDNAPVFQNEPYVSSIPEMSPTGTTVIRVTATDADDPQSGTNARLLYSILQGEPYFSVEPKTGDHLLIITRRFELGRKLPRPHSASTTVTVSLTDVNDNGPTFQHRERQPA